MKIKAQLITLLILALLVTSSYQIEYGNQKIWKILKAGEAKIGGNGSGGRNGSSTHSTYTTTHRVIYEE